MEKVLIIHNRYEHRGGEDTVMEAELELLRQRGHEVELFEKTYAELQAQPRWKVALNAIWNPATAQALRQQLGRFQPDVVHFHNAFPLVSYGAYQVVGKAGYPIIQTMHNFRWMCAQAQLFRDQKVCEDCIGHFPWRGVLHGCYRGSRVQTAASLVPLAVHRALGTFPQHITLFIALNEFCRAKFIEGGLPAAKFRVKPNFISAQPLPNMGPRQGGLFVGRLSKEKGLDVLAAAAATFAEPPVTVIGGGDLEVMARTTFGAKFRGFQDLGTILTEMAQAAYLVIPSTWYENFPRTIVESFAMGLPVIASRLGAMAEIVEDGVTGLHFQPGNAVDLAAKIQWAQAHPAEMATMGRNAYDQYLTRYSADTNYAQLTAIYREAIQLKRAA